MKIRPAKQHSDEDLYVGCRPVTGAPGEDASVVAGAKHGECGTCGCAIWVSPSSFAIQVKYPRARFACLACAVAEIKRRTPDGERPRIGAPTPAQDAEMFSATGGETTISEVFAKLGVPTVKTEPEE